MKFLIVGLGNIGDEYLYTRHNVGFLVLDALAKASNTSFETDRYGERALVKFKGKLFVLIKPSTFMNLSGKAVRYWLEKEKIPKENLLVVTDDIALPYGKLRMKGKGSDGGHNGLKSIQDLNGGSNYPRLRFGIGNEYSQGRQVDYVLGEWSQEETDLLSERLTMAGEMVRSFGLIGLPRTMNQYNNK